MSDYVFALDTVSVRINSIPVPVQIGAAFHKDDPVVLVHPELFSPDPVFIHRTPGYEIPKRLEEPTVEQATAAPGEKRGARRG